MNTGNTEGLKPYIIFLRAVMPTGKNKVPMSPLRELLTRNGLVDVRTYIQSGNVLARSRLRTDQLERLVHDGMQKQFGADLVVIARLSSQVRRIFLGNPFKGMDKAHIYFVILAGRPNEGVVRALGTRNFMPDQFVATPEAIYLYCPNGYNVSKVKSNFFEKQLGVSMTMRNYNTMAKLAELSQKG